MEQIYKIAQDIRDLQYSDIDKEQRIKALEDEMDKVLEHLKITITESEEYLHFYYEYLV